MLYPRNGEKELPLELFRNPTSEYRGTPFWAWNNKLDPDQLVRQIDYFEEMGLGGFHMHCRTGLDTPYMGEEFLEAIRRCVERAEEKGMLAYLYDEDRWPSGAAGGLVTCDPQYRSRYLVFTPVSNEERGEQEKLLHSSMAARSQGNGTLVARYDVTLRDGCLADYRRLSDGEQGGNVWYLYLEIAPENPWYNNQTYVDTLNKEAIAQFVEKTHEPYHKLLKEHFGKTVPSIFTDEPQFSHKTTLGFGEERGEVVLPYTGDFDRVYREAYGEEFLDHLPEVVWELPEGKVSLTRYHYHDCIAEMFASAFADTIGAWCRDHGIMLTGHMMEEPTLWSQTAALGDAMRSYRGFQLPGIDMLCDWREYTTAKQAQSASHQYGNPGVLSELYGVTNWNFDFRGHKLQGDWQAALGITTRVQHLSWVSMAGEAKRDYPASIFYQSPWYKEYKAVEDHFARVNTAMTRGKARVRVGVVHPVESYWLHFGPKEQTQMIRQELEDNFGSITNWLLFSHIDFDFISESLLPGQHRESADALLHVGEMAYEAVVVPGCETIRRSTLDRLKAFADAGGTVIFAGDPPRYVDAVPSGEAAELAARCTTVPFLKTRVIAALEPYRDVEIRREDGAVADHLLYQLREDGNCRWLFVANGQAEWNKDVSIPHTLTLTLGGEWSPEQYDTLTGEVCPLAAEYKGGNTVIRRELYNHDSLLLRLAPGKSGSIPVVQEAAYDCVAVLDTPVPYTLSEPNVLLLDQAEFSMDGSPWQPREELLRIDNVFRGKLGYPLRMEALAQPWTEKDVGKADHTLSLRFTVDSLVEVKAPSLALEESAVTAITVNGSPVEKRDAGYFVDESIRTIPLPGLKAGRNTIQLDLPFTRKTNVEWCYLLGDFGVQVAGSSALLVERPEKLGFSDYASQYLPFYAGNVSYRLEVESDGGEYALKASKFRAPLLSVEVDGKRVGTIAFAPYLLELGRLAPGKHTVTITSYGNRVNAFGSVHNCDEKTTWFGPNGWRTTGESFSYEYHLERMGLLKAPELFRK